MKDDLFAELLESVRQGGAILRGKRRPSRTFRFIEPNVRALRKSYRLSQAKFAALMGISAATLRNWEQGRRRPEGSARILLRVVAHHPEAVLDVVTKTSSKRLERTGRRASRHGRSSFPAGRSAAGR
jgi:putative transcriptional regulator